MFKSKHWLTSLLSCITLLAFTISPCNCFAEETSIESTNPHDCCNEDKSSNNSQHDQCDECSGCLISSKCSSLVGVEKTSQNTWQVNAENSTKLLLTTILLPTLTIQTNTIAPSAGPPNFRITSSATLPTILHRWLI